MGTVLEFRSLPTVKRREQTEGLRVGEVVIFPGVRVERYDLDLGHRVKNSAGRDDFGGLGSNRPRKSG